MKCTVFENEDEIFIFFNFKFDFKGDWHEPYCTATIEKISFKGFGTVKDVKAYIKKHEMKQCGEFQVKDRVSKK